MSLIAELFVSGEPFAMREALAEAPGMRAEPEWMIPTSGEFVEFVWAWGGDFEAFEAALPDDPTVEGFELIENDGDRRFYEVVLNGDAAILDPVPLHRETQASQLSLVTTGEGAIIRERLPDRDSLSEYIRICREHGYSVELLRAYPAENAHGEYDLSEKQAETLRAALEAGYFEVPRGTDLQSLADRLGVSEQAVSERIRRGLSAMLGSTIGDEPTETGPSAGGRSHAGTKPATDGGSDGDDD